MLNLTQVRGIGSATAGKLEAAGCTTVQDLLKISATDLSQQTGTSAKVAENIIQAATDLLKGLAGNSPVGFSILLLSTIHCPICSEIS